MGPGQNAEKYTPNHTKLKDEQGRHVHDRLRAKSVRRLLRTQTLGHRPRRKRIYFERANITC